MIIMPEIQIESASHHDESSPDTSNRCSSLGDSLDEELIHDLNGALTLDDATGGSATSPTRCGRTSRRTHDNRRSRAKRAEEEEKYLLREKFEIESLYIQISELKRENEALREMWESVRQSTNEKQS